MYTFFLLKFVPTVRACPDVASLLALLVPTRHTGGMKRVPAFENGQFTSVIDVIEADGAILCFRFLCLARVAQGLGTRLDTARRHVAYRVGKIMAA